MKQYKDPEWVHQPRWEVAYFPGGLLLSEFLLDSCPQGICHQGQRLKNYRHSPNRFSSPPSSLFTLVLTTIGKVMGDVRSTDSCAYSPEAGMAVLVVKQAFKLMA